MYCSFFGLKKLPFKISPDLSFFYTHAARDDIAHALLYSIERGDGIIKVVGEVGVGKTTLLRLLAEKLADSYQKIYISSPNLSSIDFLKFICSELRIETLASDTKLDLMNRLNQFLLSEYAQNRRMVMLVDEAQAMTLDTLEEIRLLGNLETGEDKLLQIVLFGQPELDLTLNDPRVKPLKDRIACSVAIPALKAEEVMQYLNYRMRVAGYMGQDLFTLKLARRIQQLTQGLPRSINLLADKLLMVAFSKGDNKLKPQHFKNLLSEYDLPSMATGKPFKRKGGWMMVAIVALVAIITVVLLPIKVTWFNLLAQPDLIASEEFSAPEKPPGLADFEPSKPSVATDGVADKFDKSADVGLYRPSDLASTFNIPLSQLVEMADLQQKTQAHLQAKSPQALFIVMAPMPIATFDKIYHQIKSRLYLTNRRYLFALFEVDLTNKVYQYQLIYDPRITDLKGLQQKQQDLISVSQIKAWQINPLANLQLKIQQLKQSGNNL